MNLSTKSCERDRIFYASLTPELRRFFHGRPHHPSWQRNTRPCRCDVCGSWRDVGEAVKVWCKRHKHVTFQCAAPLPNEDEG